jgi:hypothetical protein
MPIVKEPRPLPSDLSYVPPGTKPYKVSDQDSWWVLADRSDIKATGLSANDLCHLNFKTRDPPEINWYLYRKVGCRRASANGRNYCFSNADQPGIVYLPTPGPPKPVTAVVPITPSARNNIWVGVGASVGVEFFVVGIDTMTGVVASLDEFGKAMVVTASTNRFGPGFGTSGGMTVILVSGVSSPGQLSGHQEGGWDANLSLGGKWDSVAKAKKFMPLVRVMQKIAKTPAGLKRVLADPGNWADFVKFVKGAIEGLDLGSEPKVTVIGVPLLGGGAEASVFFGVSNFNAVWDNQ